MLHIEEEVYLTRHSFALPNSLHDEAEDKPRKKKATLSKKKKKEPKAQKEKRWMVINREHPISAPGWEESGDIFLR